MFTLGCDHWEILLTHHTFRPPSYQDYYRLPEGMKRVGYDADTGRYTFKDRSGTFWKGPEGAEFGEMTRGENCNRKMVSVWMADGIVRRVVTSVVTSGNSGPQGCDETQSADFDSSSDLEALVAGAKKEEEYSDNEVILHTIMLCVV